jgi:ATP-dependent RNA helicase SUPV3L1/SUV3
LQAESLALRHAMIEEAKVLGAAAELRIDAVKALQQRWQAQAHRIPMDRRHEQKLWDAFRKPIDDAFNRKTAEREKAEAALGARDRMVLQAAKALDAANASGDAHTIRAAMAALEAALQGQAQAQADVQSAGTQEIEAKAAAQASGSDQNASSAPANIESVATESVADTALLSENSAPDAAAEAVVDPVAPAKPAPKRVIAARGDDRPGTKKEVPAMAGGRPGKWGDRNDASRGPRDAPARWFSEAWRPGVQREWMEGTAGRPATRFGAPGHDRPQGWQDAPTAG